MINGERLALVTGSKDRSSNLRLALSTWIELPEPDVLVVVDFGSAEPLQKILADFHDPRLVVVRAEEKSWQNSRCHNLEFQVASRLECDLVLRIDNDALVDPTFFANHPVNDESFWAVDCHHVSPEEDDKRNLCGTILVATRHWRRANGYNERLVQYGYEDEDFYARLCGTGLTWRRCLLRTLDHISHPNRSRLANLSSGPKLLEMFGHLPPEEADESAKNFLLILSRQIAAVDPWTSLDLMTRWEIEFDHNYGTATPVAKSVSSETIPDLATTVEIGEKT